MRDTVYVPVVIENAFKVRVL